MFYFYTTSDIRTEFVRCGPTSLTVDQLVQGAVAQPSVGSILNNIEATTPNIGDVIKYTGSKWQLTTLPDMSTKADASTTYTKSEVDGLIPDMSTKADANYLHKEEVDA